MSDKPTISNLLRGMPVEEQLALLLFAIIEANSNALSVSLRMLNATTMLSKGLSSENRFKISEAMRDTADVLERPRVEIEIK